MIDEQDFENVRREYAKEFRKSLIVSFKGFSLFFGGILSVFIISGLLSGDKNTGEREFSFSNPGDIAFVTILSFLCALAMILLLSNDLFHYLSVYKHASRYKEQIESLVNKNKAFIFYLRDFESGRHSETAKNIGGGGSYEPMVSFVMGNFRSRIILKEIRNSMPVVYLCNKGELTKGMGGYYLLASDLTWYRYFKILADKATFIICDYSEVAAQSTNIAKEIEYMTALCQKKIIIFSTPFKLAKLTGLYPDFEKGILYHNPTQFVTDEENNYGPSYRQPDDDTKEGLVKGEYRIEVDKKLIELITSAKIM